MWQFGRANGSTPVSPSVRPILHVCTATVFGDGIHGLPVGCYVSRITLSPCGLTDHSISARANEMTSLG